MLRYMSFKFLLCQIPSYGLFVGVALVIGMYLSEHYGRVFGFKPWVLWYMALLIGMGGALGSVFMYSITFDDQIAEASTVYGGQRSYFGGFIIGLALGWLYCRLLNISFLLALDCAAPAIALAHSFGRIGCLLYGCCFGRVCDGTLAVTFPRVQNLYGETVGTPAYVHHVANSWIASDCPASLPVIPVQIYEILFLLCLYVMLRIALFRRPSRIRSEGFVFGLYLVLYGIGRFTMELLRDEGGHYLAWNKSQGFCVSIFLIGLALIAFRLNIRKLIRGLLGVDVRSRGTR